MDERDLRGLLDQVKAGGVSRRSFVKRMAAVGFTAPMATQLLGYAGVAMAQSKPAYKPTKRGGGGLLKVLWWQGPTLLNPHFATGTKDQDGSRLFYEPLAGWDRDGNLRPILAEAIPGREDGTLAADGKSVTWKLKKGVTWHDGQPFTADDVIFNWEYAVDSATATVSIGSYSEIEKVETLELKGGGDAVSAARAVLQTGEYDYAWNLQVEDDVLNRLERGGRGRVDIVASGNIEHIQCNFTDPWKEVDGERSSVKAPHPLLTDPAVRQALNLLVDRASIQEHVYGRTGIVTANYLNRPPRFASKNTRWEFNIDKANQLLDAAGWKRGPDGVRAKAGKKLKLVYQTSINALRQKTQAIIKQTCAKAGIEIEIKSVVASVFFSSDPANPDTNSHFYSDIQMYSILMTAPDPRLFMRQFTSWAVAAKANKWQERNITRWRNEEYDRSFLAAETELDPVKRAALFTKMNDLVIQNVVVIPVVLRSQVAGISLKLRDVVQSGWDSDFWHLPYWYREA